MQYIPSEFPFACWLVGGGCWRWFTLTSVLMYYYFWIKVERGTAKPIYKKGFSAWHAEHRSTIKISYRARHVQIPFYWHHLMFIRASLVAFIVCFFELCPDIWERYFFAPWLRGCWISADIVFSGCLHAQTWWLYSACKLVCIGDSRKCCTLSLNIRVASGGLIECCWSL